MDKFAQISLDFFNNPSPSNGDKEMVTGESNDSSQFEQAEYQAAQNLQDESMPSLQDPRVNEVPSEELQNEFKAQHINLHETSQVLQQNEDPEILPEPNFLGAPGNDLVSLVDDVDHQDIIDFTILAEKEETYEQQELVSKSTRGRKSLKSFDRQAENPEIPGDEILNQKQYYSIGEVAVMFRVNPSLLRFWEAEFDIIQPRKNKKGDRHFRPVDIRNLELIYDLLRRRKLTIEGAREYLKKNSRANERYDMIQSLQKIRSFLLELKTNL